MSVQVPANPINPLGLVTGLVSVDGFETIEFADKANLILNGNAGDDVINLNYGIAPSLLTSITVNGGDPTASDTVIVNGSAASDNVTFAPSATAAMRRCLLGNRLIDTPVPSPWVISHRRGSGA